MNLTVRTSFFASLGLLLLLTSSPCYTAFSIPAVNKQGNVTDPNLKFILNKPTRNVTTQAGVGMTLGADTFVYTQGIVGQTYEIYVNMSAKKGYFQVPNQLIAKYKATVVMALYEKTISYKSGNHEKNQDADLKGINDLVMNTQYVSGPTTRGSDQIYTNAIFQTWLPAKTNQTALPSVKATIKHEPMTVYIIPVNHKPTINVGKDAYVNVWGLAMKIFGKSVTITDMDSAFVPMTVTVTLENAYIGELSMSTIGLTDVTYYTKTSMVKELKFKASPTMINKAIQKIVFLSTRTFAGPTYVQVTVNDHNNADDPLKVERVVSTQIPVLVTCPRLVNNELNSYQKNMCHYTANITKCDRVRYCRAKPIKYKPLKLAPWDVVWDTTFASMFDTRENLDLARIGQYPKGIYAGDFLIDSSGTLRRGRAGAVYPVTCNCQVGNFVNMTMIVAGMEVGGSMMSDDVNRVVWVACTTQTCQLQYDATSVYLDYSQEASALNNIGVRTASVDDRTMAGKARMTLMSADDVNEAAGASAAAESVPPKKWSMDGSLGVFERMGGSIEEVEGGYHWTGSRKLLQTKPSYVPNNEGYAHNSETLEEVLKDANAPLSTDGKVPSFSASAGAGRASSPSDSGRRTFHTQQTTGTSSATTLFSVTITKGLWVLYIQPAVESTSFSSRNDYKVIFTSAASAILEMSPVALINTLNYNGWRMPVMALGFFFLVCIFCVFVFQWVRKKYPTQREELYKSQQLIMIYKIASIAKSRFSKMVKKSSDKKMPANMPVLGPGMAIGGYGGPPPPALANNEETSSEYDTEEDDDDEAPLV